MERFQDFEIRNYKNYKYSFKISVFSFIKSILLIISINGPIENSNYKCLFC